MSAIANMTDGLRRSGAGRWYQSKSSGEQTVVLVVGTLLVLTLLWLLLWKPLSDWRTLEHNRYENARSTLDWLRANEPRARAAATVKGAAGNDRSLMALVTRAADGLGLKLSRLQPIASGGVTVVLSGQKFDDLLSWIVQLKENNAVSVSNLSVTRQDQPGLVDAQVDFR